MAKSTKDSGTTAPKRKPGRQPRAKKTAAAATAAVAAAVAAAEKIAPPAVIKTPAAPPAKPAAVPAPVEAAPAPKKKRAVRTRSKKAAAAVDTAPELPLVHDEPPAPAAPPAPAVATPASAAKTRAIFTPAPKTENAPDDDSREVAHAGDESVSSTSGTDHDAANAAADSSVTHIEPPSQQSQQQQPPSPSQQQQQSQEDTAASAPARQQSQDQQDQQQQQQGNGGQQPPYESYWKRVKREKKEKKARKWAEQQSARQGGGGGQHGGGGHPGKYPPQPPPPNLNPVHGDLPAPDRFADPAALDALAVEIAGDTTGHEPIYLEKLYALTLAELTAEARRRGAVPEGIPNRRQLLSAIFKIADAQKIPLLDNGYIDLTDRGYGFIVHESVNYRLYPENAYLPASLVKRYGLKRGHRVQVLVQAPRENERCPAAVKVNHVMDMPPDEISKTVPFEELTPYYPLKRILLEAPGVHKDVSMRAVDILTPVGFGQRGLIVAPPRTGKTILLQNMANSISANFPDVTLILLLVDERPEEVTDFKRHTKGEVVASTFDEAPESHVHAAEMVGEKARRMVEQGRHVVILLDSITRLARAYNALASNSGKIMSGGMEATALQKPKRFFGAARNIEGGGSLTVMGTALIDTGSRMDEVIFEEFKGTGNMELHLDRGLVDKRIFPAINMDRSGTRKEELIYHPDEMLRIYGLRRAMQGIPAIDAMEMFLQRLKKTKTNAEFLMGLNR
jgi:transcription termination factor Rho